MTSQNSKPHPNPNGRNVSREESSKSVREDFEKLVSLFKKNGMVYAPKVNGLTRHDDPTDKK